MQYHIAAISKLFTTHIMQYKCFVTGESASVWHWMKYTYHLTLICSKQKNTCLERDHNEELNHSGLTCRNNCGSTCCMYMFVMHYANVYLSQEVICGVDILPPT